jgi:hypothetical protein
LNRNDEVPTSFSIWAVAKGYWDAGHAGERARDFLCAAMAYETYTRNPRDPDLIYQVTVFGLGNRRLGRVPPPRRPDRPAALAALADAAALCAPAAMLHRSARHKIGQAPVIAWKPARG